MLTFSLASCAKGFGTGAGLIIAIGAQNAFVLRQGITRQHIFITALLCSLIDALLIALGVGGLGSLIATNSFLIAVATWGGAAFLFYYGFRAFRRAFTASTLHIDDSFEKPNLQAVILTLLALSFLNPHVYLDTVVLIGSIGAQFPESERIVFALGAMAASFLWFFALSYGAGFLEPLFRKPASWKILDVLIGCVMWTIAATLVWSAISCL